MCDNSVKSLGWATKMIPGQIVNNEKKHWGKLRILGNNSSGMFIACSVKLLFGAFPIWQMKKTFEGSCQKYYNLPQSF